MFVGCTEKNGENPSEEKSYVHSKQLKIRSNSNINALSGCINVLPAELDEMIASYFGMRDLCAFNLTQRKYQLIGVTRWKYFAEMNNYNLNWRCAKNSEGIPVRRMNYIFTKIFFDCLALSPFCEDKVINKSFLKYERLIKASDHFKMFFFLKFKDDQRSKEDYENLKNINYPLLIRDAEENSGEYVLKGLFDILEENSKPRSLLKKKIIEQGFNVLSTAIERNAKCVSLLANYALNTPNPKQKLCKLAIKESEKHIYKPVEFSPLDTPNLKQELINLAIKEAEKDIYEPLEFLLKSDVTVLLYLINNKKIYPPVSLYQGLYYYINEIKTQMNDIEEMQSMQVLTIIDQYFNEARLGYENKKMSVRCYQFSHFGQVKFYLKKYKEADEFFSKFKENKTWKEITRKDIFYIYSLKIELEQWQEAETILSELLARKKYSFVDAQKKSALLDLYSQDPSRFYSHSSIKFSGTHYMTMLAAQDKYNHGECHSTANMRQYLSKEGLLAYEKKLFDNSEIIYKKLITFYGKIDDLPFEDLYGLARTKFMLQKWETLDPLSEKLETKVRKEENISCRNDKGFSIIAGITKFHLGQYQEAHNYLEKAIKILEDNREEIPQLILSMVRKTREHISFPHHSLAI